MFQITKKEKKSFEYLELYSACSKNKAKICLNNGGNLEELIVENCKIITDLSPLKYQQTYASSILFPFANRVKDGKFHFLEKNYTLDCNEVEANNALHGLIYNKRFKLVDNEINSKYAKVLLSFEEKDPHSGFPFLYKIDLHYKLSMTILEIDIKITNTGTEKFPFTLGWHPYFYTSNISKSKLRFKSVQKVKSDNRNITTKITDLKTPNPLDLDAISLDDAFVLDTNKVEFETPVYKAKLSSSNSMNYLQLYTPNNSNAIAIEPMTGVSNSFNNRIGLKELSPKENYTTKWQLKLLILNN